MWKTQSGKKPKGKSGKHVPIWRKQEMWCIVHMKGKKYIEQLPLHTVKNILKTRLHMNTLPGNYKGTSVKWCPLCNSDKINLEHYIQCRVTKRLANVWNVKKSSLDCDDIPTLIRVSQFAINVSQIVEPAMKIQK